MEVSQILEVEEVQSLIKDFNLSCQYSRLDSCLWEEEAEVEV